MEKQKNLVFRKSKSLKSLVKNLENNKLITWAFWRWLFKKLTLYFQNKKNDFYKVNQFESNFNEVNPMNHHVHMSLLQQYFMSHSHTTTKSHSVFSVFRYDKIDNNNIKFKNKIIIIKKFIILNCSWHAFHVEIFFHLK